MIKSQKASAVIVVIALLFVAPLAGLNIGKAAYGQEETKGDSWNIINTALGDVPIKLVQNITGLVNVIQYLDTRRARI